MFIKQGDAQPISVLSTPADVSDESTHKQLEKTLNEVKASEHKDEDKKDSK